MTPPNAVGYANGVAQSIVSLARCLGPSLGGYVSRSAEVAGVYLITQLNVHTCRFGQRAFRMILVDITLGLLRVLLSARFPCFKPSSSVEVLYVRVFFLWSLSPQLRSPCIPVFLDLSIIFLAGMCSVVSLHTP